MINESTYLELMKGCAGWNTRLNKERTPRVPFIDQQTHIAQLPRKRTITSHDRQLVGTDLGTSYVYPSEPWKRSPEYEGPSISQLLNIKPGVGVPESADFTGTFDISNVDANDTTVEEPKPALQAHGKFVDYSEMSDEDEEQEDGSDQDEYEEFYSKRRRGRGAQAQAVAATTQQGTQRSRRAENARRRRQAAAAEKAAAKQQEQQQQAAAAAAAAAQRRENMQNERRHYNCAHCRAAYKSRAGLNYHMHHVHGQNIVTNPDEGREVPANADCDFCLGDASENKKTGKAEQLVSCHDCGRAGHPTCLNFTNNMMVSTTKYGWQCIECKSCAICGTSDNDDVLLFCDDCDRGFHLYCLNPPLQSAPDDEWSCHLCQVAFGDKASLPAGKAPKLKAQGGPPSIPPPHLQ